MQSSLILCVEPQATETVDLMGICAVSLAVAVFGTRSETLKMRNLWFLPIMVAIAVILIGFVMCFVVLLSSEALLAGP